MSELSSYARDVADRARAAAADLAVSTGGDRNAWLGRAAELVRASTVELFEANRGDLDRAEQLGLNAAAIDRLTLTDSRLEGIARTLDDVAGLPDPVGEVIDSNCRPNGLLVTRVRVPLGVVFFVYESRPNVTADAAAVCVKSGNAVILRGGSEAIDSNVAIYRLLRTALDDVGLPADAVQLVESTDRDAVGEFLKLGDAIDVAIPRGGRSLIERMVAEATMPVIKHFDGVCHVYVDRSADLEMAAEIVINSKCQRPGVCNAAEGLLVHEAIAGEFLPRVAEQLAAEGVELRGCRESCRLVPAAVPATDEDFRTEYLDLVLSVRTVVGLAEAIGHINEYGSGHTDAIVTSDLVAAREFTAAVDSSAVMVNASTRFHDGGEFGLGAEIGISTDKFHARGPCGLKELTSYKYVVHGSGQLRG